MLPYFNTRGIPCHAVSSWMLRWPCHQQTFLGLWVGGTLSHQRKSLEAQHLASPPVPFVAANEASWHYSGPGAGCEPPSAVCTHPSDAGGAAHGTKRGTDG